jgi:hypothetical protein
MRARRAGACRGGAIAKCVEWGYRPWATAVECDDERCFEISLTDHHQACTRMARADYCGDGTPHTENGTLIDIYDDLSPPIASAEAAGHHSWGVEAEWGPAGATCVGKSLRLDILDSSTQVPSCLKDLKDLEACGSFDASRPESRLANYFCTKFDFKPELCD